MEKIERLIKNVRGEVGLLRPFTTKETGDTAFVTLSNGQTVERDKFSSPLVRNVTALPLDSYKAIDKAIMGYQKDYNSAFNDVLAKSLTHNVSEYSKLFTSQKIGGTEDAVKDMDGVSGRSVDTPTFDDDSLPMFCTHKDFEISWRDKGAFGTLPYDGGSAGIDWDSSMLQDGVYKINQLNEKTIMQGYAVPYASNYVYGYTNFPSRNEVDLTYDWTTATPGEIFEDIQDMWKAGFTDNLQPISDGVFYVYPSVFHRFNEDYSTSYGKTLYDRVLGLPGVEAIRVSSQVPAAKQAVFVRMDASSVRIVRATNGIIPIMWHNEDSRTDKMTLLSIQEPQLRADVNGYTSIVHATKS